MKSTNARTRARELAMQHAGLTADATLQSYRLLCGRTVPLALARGSIDASTAAQLHRLLEAELQ